MRGIRYIPWMEGTPPPPHGTKKPGGRRRPAACSTHVRPEACTEDSLLVSGTTLNECLQQCSEAKKLTFSPRAHKPL